MDWKSFTFMYTMGRREPIMNLLIEIEASKRTVERLLLPPPWMEALEQLNRVRTIHGTTALEGNPLSESQVEAYLESETDPSAATREVQQILNAGMAQTWVRERFQPDQPPLTVADVLHMHELMTRRSDEHDNVPGRLRLHDVRVGTEDLGGVHRGAPHGELPRLMDEFTAFVNSGRVQAEHPVIRALLAHFFLVTIHPFGDGNGRVSRLVEAAILYQGGYNVHGFYGLSNYFYRNGDLYKRLLQECRKQRPFEVTTFVEFGLHGFDAELKGISGYITSRLNCVLYRDMMTRSLGEKVGKRRRLLNHREYLLLDFLLQETEPDDPFSSEHPLWAITLSDLEASPFVRAGYGKVTRRTFLRELARLEELGFIFTHNSEDAGEPIIGLDFEAIAIHGSA